MNLPPFQRLVDEHWHAVARLAHALAGPVDGDDVAQQAWTQALAAYPTLSSGKNLSGWLLTITARCATDAHRARSRRPVPVDRLPEPSAPGASPAVPGSAHRSVCGPVPGSGSGAASVSGTGEPSDPLDDVLWAAVRALPERQRTALALRYVVDLDHAEIARTLSTTPGATRRLVSDALTTLRATLPAAAGHPADPARRTEPGPAPAARRTSTATPRETR